MAITRRERTGSGGEIRADPAGAPDAERQAPREPVPGAEFDFPCDMVIPALGQSKLVEMLGKTRGIEISGGSIVVDRAHGPHGKPAVLRRRRLRERRPRGGGRGGGRQEGGAGHRGGLAEADETRAAARAASRETIYG